MYNSGYESIFRDDDLDFEITKMDDNLFSEDVYTGKDVRIFQDGYNDMFFCKIPKERVSVNYYKPKKPNKTDYILSSLMNISNIKSDKQKEEFIQEVKNSNVVVIVEPLAKGYIEMIGMNMIYSNRYGNLVFPAAFALLKLEEERMEIIAFSSNLKLDHDDRSYTSREILKYHLDEIVENRKKKNKFETIGKNGFSKTVIY